MTQDGLLLKIETKLELEREEMSDVIQKELEQHPHVMAFFYETPRHMRLNENIYLNVVIQPAFYTEFSNHRRSLATIWGEVLFYEEDYYEGIKVIIHYKNLIKVHLRLLKPQDLKPSFQYKNIEISYDPYGIVTYISDHSESSEYRMTFEELDNWRTKFFANYYELHRSLNRREMYQAIHTLDVMRWLIATMWMIRANVQPNKYLDWTSIEGTDSVLTEEQREKLRMWKLTEEPKELTKTLKLVVEEFKLLHCHLCQEFSVIEDPDYVERIIAHAKIAG